MNQYKQGLSKINNIKAKLQADRKEIYESGRDNEWKSHHLKAAVKEAKDAIRAVNEELKEIAGLYLDYAEEMVADARKKPWPGNHKIDYNELSFHKGLAFDSFKGLKPEEVLQAFDRVVGQLRDKELNNKWVYELAAAEAINDPSYDIALNDAFDKHRTQYEKATRNELERRKRFLDNDSTIRGIAEQDIESISEGEKPLYDDFYTLYDELMSPIDPGDVAVKINPVE